jgi:hypothetical protein
VLLLQPPTPPSPGLPPNKTDSLSLRSDVLKAFGIDITGSALDKFLTVLEKAGALVTKVTPPTGDRGLAPTNAMWLTSTTSTYNVSVRMTFSVTLDPSDSAKSAINWINSQFGTNFKTSDIKFSFGVPITLTKTTVHTSSVSKDDRVFDSYLLSYTMALTDFYFYFDFTKNSKSFLLTPSPEQAATSIGTLLTSLPGAPDIPGDDVIAGLFNHFYLWYIRLEETHDASGKASLSWGIGVLAGRVFNTVPVMIALTYDSASSTFTGKLMLDGDFPSASDRRMPTYDDRLSTDIIKNQITGGTDLGTTLNLWDLFGVDHLSDRIPSSVAAAQISYKMSGTDNTTILSFSTDIVRAPTSLDTGGAGAPTGFSWDEISVNASLTKPKDQPSTTHIQIFSSFTLAPVNDLTIDPATLSVMATYDTGAWSLYGSVRNLSVALIADYFDEGCRSGAMAVLGHITLAKLEMFYTYHKASSGDTASTASSFLISASIVLGELELDLSYQYVSSVLPTTEQSAAMKKWDPANDAKNKLTASTDSTPMYVTPLKPAGKNEFKFEAYLTTTQPNATIADVAESIVPGSKEKLPKFVGDIQIVSPKSMTPQPPIALHYEGSSEEGTILTVNVSIAMFSLTFVQVSDKPVNGKPPTLKRLIRFSVDQIPMMEDIPLIGKMPQPFDHLIYMWVEDTDTTSKNPGITRAMFNKINALIPPLQIKDEKKDPKDEDLVIAAGHHFVVVANGKVVLDHVFSASREPDAKPKALVAHTDPNKPAPSPNPVRVISPGIQTSAAAADPAPQADAPPTTGNTNTTAGPLSIKGLSVQYKDESLFVSLDATLNLGPLTFSVIGFTLQIELGQVHLDSLADIVTKHLIHASLHGIEAGLTKGPLTLKGVFVHDNTGAVTQKDGTIVTKESYRGGIAVGFKVWQVLAVGEYQIVTVQKGTDTSSYRSVFV